MGSVSNISIDLWPKQGSWFSHRVKVCFHYDTARTLNGVIVRDDNEDPWVTIIKLDDGRFILASECQYSPQAEEG